MSDINQLHAEIRACRICFDAGYPISLPPMASGSAPAPFMIIGQAPSLTDLRVGETYSGPAGKKLREWMLASGFDEEDFGTQIYPAALTKCFPGRLPGKSTDRAPSLRERMLCRPWLDRQTTLVNPTVIVLFGKLAIDTFLGAGSLTERIGREFDWRGIICIPFPHSSGASTWLNAPEHRQLLDAAIQLLSDHRTRLVS